MIGTYLRDVILMNFLHSFGKVHAVPVEKLAVYNFKED